jgi:hypothetical protein
MYAAIYVNDSLRILKFIGECDITLKALSEISLLNTVNLRTVLMCNIEALRKDLTVRGNQIKGRYSRCIRTYSLNILRAL